MGKTDKSYEIPSHPELDCGLGEWDALLYGNHRIVVRVDEAPCGGVGGPGAPAVSVELPWRRRDPEPEKTDVIVRSAATGTRVRNVTRSEVGRAVGRIIFEPVDGPGEYHVYYLPYAQIGSAWYPQATYLPWREAADPDWQLAVRYARSGAGSAAGSAGLPSARAVRYEAASAHDSFAPMGFTASEAETAELLARHPGEPFLLFPEDRTLPIELTRHLPARWAAPSGTGAFAPLRGTTRRGENYAFQIGVLATDADISITPELELPFPARSLANSGVFPDGQPFTRAVEIPAGRLRALWFTVDIPADAEPGEHSGSVGIGKHSIPVTLTVTTETAADGGTGEPELMTRLTWLDSQLAADDELVAPYTEVTADAAAPTRLSILGRTVELGAGGLPVSITSSFTPEVTGTDGPVRELLAGPVEFDGGDTPWTFDGTPEPEPAGPARMRWTQRGHAGPVGIEAGGSLEADGCLSYGFALRAGDSAAELPGVTLRIPLRREVARYLMGLGEQGRTVPETLDWAWSVAEHNQDALWIGDVNAGLQLALRDRTYRRPLNTNYYREQPLREPRSWGNGGRGGVRLRADGARYLLEAYSGPLRLEPGETLDFDFRLLLTPFKPIEPGRQLRERYFHAYVPPADAAEYGASVLNVHHASPPAPFINDPLLRADRLRAHVGAAHAAGLRVKVYDTVRELTTRSPETHALKSLNGEVYASGPGGGHIWLQEHLGEDYVPGWHAPNVDDVAVVTAGTSRWENAYVCGLERLARTTGIDGVYLDDIAFDRTTMKRVRKVLERNRPQPLIDIHSANQFNVKDGYASSANLYLEHLAYADRLWLGEYIDYENTDPVYWLLEVSGIPFGLMGEMLEGGGNPWRGMAFGITGRAPQVDSRALWRFWDEVRLPEARMLGWWSGQQAVRTGREDVLATVWVGAGSAGSGEADGPNAVVSLASWAEDVSEVRLAFDAEALGFVPGMIQAVEIDGFQQAAEYAVGGPVTVEPNKGRLLLITP